ncbi:MAG: hypothetical protein AB7S26_18820 [Sandaracinaceae bacterium]
MSGRAAEWVVRLGLPLAVMLVIFAVFLGEELAITHEVSLVAPRGAAPGDTLPVRAIVFQDIDRPLGASIADVPVDVGLFDAEGRALVERRLDRSALGGAEGDVLIPSDARGTLELRAFARDPEGQPLASAASRVELSTSPPAAAVHGRLAGALQRLSLGPLEILEGGLPTDLRDARVVGAACAPEAPCTILVEAPAPGAAVAIERSPSVEPVGEPGAERAGVVGLEVVTHGPEANAVLTASRASAVVARRPIQVATALATPGVSIPRRLLRAGDPVELEVHLLDAHTAIVDAYLDDRWLHTATVAIDDDAPERLPFALAPGEWTLEVRGDPFSDEYAAVQRIAIGITPSLEAAPPGDDEDRFAWIAADHEVRVHDLPDPARGYERDAAELAQRQRLLRMSALAAIVLGLLVVVVVFVRRGVDATIEAQRVMEATEDPELNSARHRRRAWLSALALIATVVLAFVGAAALVIARARLYE